MLFSEVYGVYYTVMAEILSEATAGSLTGRRVTEIVQEKAFGESVLTIPAALKKGTWPLLRDDNRTPIEHRPTMPLTTLQKRWLKTLLLDARIALFSPSPAGLEDVEPLYPPEAVVRYDQYTDGDPFGDPDYIEHFRLILRALREHRRLRVSFRGHSGHRQTVECIPCRLEYSAKDDKFRLLTAGVRTKRMVVNLARITALELLEPYEPSAVTEPAGKNCRLVFLVRDARNALERVMLHFSHLEKSTVRLEEDLYQVTLFYDREDETELLIRILSFGPMIRVISPEDFIFQIRERLDRQSGLNRQAVWENLQPISEQASRCAESKQRME